MSSGTIPSLRMDFGVFDNPRPSVDSATAARIVLDHYEIAGVAEPLVESATEASRSPAVRVSTC